MDAKKQKRLLKIKIVVVLIVVFSLLAVGMTQFLVRTVETDDDGYPKSTLLKEDKGKHSYRISKELERTYDCPSIPYEISVPGDILDTTSERLSLSYHNFGITLLETENDAQEELGNRLCSYAVSTPVDIPDTEWLDVIGDEGFINGYLAEYHTGKAKMKYRIEKKDYYAVMYSIDTGADGSGKTKLMICITCSQKNELQEAKSLLDDIVYSLNSKQTNEDVNKDTSSEKKVDDKKNTDQEKSEEFEMMDTTETLTESTEMSGVDVARKDYTIHVDEEYDTGLYIVFRWINDMSEPISLYVTDPDGNRYEKDEELSREGEWVFVVPDGCKGDYVLHGEATSAIYVNYYEAMGKEQYYMTYQNIDINTGEPVRSIGE